MTTKELIRKIFFVEIFKGMALTFSRLFTHAVTRRYPHKIRRPAQPGFRGLHAWSGERCVGCKLCAGICPSQCIYIATETDKETKKLVVKKYDIEVLRCLFCSFCVEACPEGALALTEHYEYADYSREALYMTMEKLQANWDKYMAGKVEDYFKRFWGPRPEDFSTPEEQAVFRGRK
ncbi:MAG: NADH-quinone oxidoreductase subunit I [Thermodesulfovibrionales bacterium]|nr:NADH-quinone oxidoreductase subunit I [Thermodesulfovibrionales bacterium]